MTHEYPIEHEVLNYVKKLLSKQQRKYLLSGAHYLILDNGAFYMRLEERLSNHHHESFIIQGMSHGDILIQFIQTEKGSATLLCIKPHLPPQPDFIKSWVFSFIEQLFGISFGPKGLCRYTKERPFIITPPRLDSSDNVTKNVVLLSHPTFLPSHHEFKKDLKTHKNTDHLDFKQSPKKHSYFRKF